MAVITSSKSQSAHWYHKDGKPQHTVPLAKGDGERPTNLGDARKLGLYPSVSGIIGMLDKPGLMNWKLKQMVEFALRTPRREGVSDSHYFDMVKDAAFQQVEDASEFGTRVHAEIEKFLTFDFSLGVQYPAAVGIDGYVRPAVNWMFEKKIKVLDAEKVLVNHLHGFAGTSDAPYRATKSFGILDFKTNKTKPGKPIGEYPEKILQLAAYFATYWGEAALDNPQAWAGNIYISSTERGRTVAIMYPYDAIKRAWEIFKMLCHIWRDRNEYDPRLPVTSQPKFSLPTVIEIAPPDVNPTVGETTVQPADAPVPPSTTAPSPESPSVPPSESPSLPSPTPSPTSANLAILAATKVQNEVDGIRFLSAKDCVAFTKSVPTIYSWWYNQAEDTARVGFSADGALAQTGWTRVCKAYAADIDMADRAAGKSDPVVGTNNLPIKPNTNPAPKPKEPNKDLSVSPDTLPAPAGSPERIAQLERMKLGFGKHKNVTLLAVDNSYLIWCLSQMAKDNFGAPPHVKEYLSIPSVIKAIDEDAR